MAPARGRRWPRRPSSTAPGDRILLKCGDTWNEEFAPKGERHAPEPDHHRLLRQGRQAGHRPAGRKAGPIRHPVGRPGGLQDRRPRVHPLHDRHLRGILRQLPDPEIHLDRGLLFPRFAALPALRGLSQAQDRPGHLLLLLRAGEQDRAHGHHHQELRVPPAGLRRVDQQPGQLQQERVLHLQLRQHGFRGLPVRGRLCNGNRASAAWTAAPCATASPTTSAATRISCPSTASPASMFFRCKDWVFENCEWGFVDIGGGSGDGEAFDFEGNCDNMIMQNCLFHDTDGPGFLLCCYASDGNPNKGIKMENCVINGKSKRPIRLGQGRDHQHHRLDTEATWSKCRFYLSPGEVLMRVTDPEKDKHSKFEDCLVKPLSQGMQHAQPRLKAKAAASSAVAGNEADKVIDGNEGTVWKADGSPRTVVGTRPSQPPPPSTNSVSRRIRPHRSSATRSNAGTHPAKSGQAVSTAAASARISSRRSSAGPPKKSACW